MWIVDKSGKSFRSNLFPETLLWIMFPEKAVFPISIFFLKVFICLSISFPQLFKQNADIFKLFHQVRVGGELSLDLLIGVNNSGMVFPSELCANRRI